MTLSFEEYQKTALATWNPKLGPIDSLHNTVYGLVGETGELVDALKKEQFHGVKMKLDDDLNELGDILYYLTLLCLFRGYSLEHVAMNNNQKLLRRYPNGFIEGGGKRE